MGCRRLGKSSKVLRRLKGWRVKLSFSSDEKNSWEKVEMLAGWVRLVVTVSWMIEEEGRKDESEWIKQVGKAIWLVDNKSVK